MKKLLYIFMFIILSYSVYAVDINACATLNSANTVYNLNASVSHTTSQCFSITAANITLDCNGYNITGNNSANIYSISSLSASSIIKNCNFINESGFVYGETGSTNMKILNNTGTLGGSLYCSYLKAGSGLIANNNFSTGTNVVYNVVLSTLGNNTVENNTLAGRHAVIEIATSDNIIQNNNVTGNGASASMGTVRINGGSRNIVRNNRIYVTDAGEGIYIASSFNNTLYNNHIEVSKGMGIWVTSGTGANNYIDCNGESITGTNVSTGQGIFSQLVNTTVNNCIINNFSNGIYFYFSTNSSINNTNVSTTYNSTTIPLGSSIVIRESNNVNINNVYATSTSSKAIHYYTASYNTLTNSNFIGAPAIYVEQSSSNNNMTNVYGMSTSSQVLITANSANYLTLRNVTGDATLGNIFYFGGGTDSYLDCQGGTIYGKNQTNVVAVYTSQIRTTVKNCNFNNFSTGIYSMGGTGHIIDNVTVSTSRVGGSGDYNGKGILLGTGTTYSNITNCVLNSTNNGSTYTGALQNVGNYNYASNIIATGASYGVYSMGAYNVYNNITAIGSSTQTAWALEGMSSSIINNSKMYSTSGSGFQMSSGGNGNTFMNNIFNATTGYAFEIASPGYVHSANIFINNTFISPNNVLVSISVKSYSNVFCLNNFTTTTSLYVNDTNKSNYYTCNYQGRTQGNIWPNVINGTIPVSGIVGFRSTFPEISIGRLGTLPYNNTNSLGKVSTGVVDYAPLTYSEVVMNRIRFLTTKKLIFRGTNRLRVN